MVSWSWQILLLAGPGSSWKSLLPVAVPLLEVGRSGRTWDSRGSRGVVLDTSDKVGSRLPTASFCQGPAGIALLVSEPGTVVSMGMEPIPGGPDSDQ